jgi:uncharacterized protein (DUF1330 family)
MAVYALALLKIHDRARYERYMAGFMPVLVKYQGRLIVADDAPRVLEGEWDRDKVVLLSFANDAAFNEWAASPEYLEISADRIAGATALVLQLQGIN